MYQNNMKKIILLATALFCVYSLINAVEQPKALSNKTAWQFRLLCDNYYVIRMFFLNNISNKKSKAYDLITFCNYDTLHCLVEATASKLKIDYKDCLFAILVTDSFSVKDNKQYKRIRINIRKNINAICAMMEEECFKSTKSEALFPVISSIPHEEDAARDQDIFFIKKLLSQCRP